MIVVRMVVSGEDEDLEVDNDHTRRSNTSSFIGSESDSNIVIMYVSPPCLIDSDLVILWTHT